MRHIFGSHSERGSSSVEFVIIFPVFILIFVSAFESSMLFVRQVMLERGLDISVRELRLGTGTTQTHETLRQSICKNAGILPDCYENLVLELHTVSMDTYNLPDNTQPCVDKKNNVTPTTSFVNGGQNELMVIRACFTVEAFFAVGLGLRLGEDTEGQLMMMARSAYVTEPTT